MLSWSLARGQEAIWRWMNVKDFDRHTSRKKQEIQNMGSEWVPGKSLERNASSKWQELRTGQKHSYASFEVSLQLMSSTLISWHVSLSHQHYHYGSISCPILLAPLNITFTIPCGDCKNNFKRPVPKTTSFIVDWFVQILLVRWCHIPRRWKRSSWSPSPISKILSCNRQKVVIPNISGGWCHVCQASLSPTSPTCHVTWTVHIQL